MKPMTNQEYVGYAGQRCPYCSSSEVETAGQLQADASIVWQAVKCGACGEEWTDQYTLIGYAPVE